MDDKLPQEDESFDGSLQWVDKYHVSHSVILCDFGCGRQSKVTPIKSYVRCGIEVRSELAKLFKGNMIEHNARLTILNAGCWATRADTEDGAQAPVDQYFLNSFDDVEPAWPDKDVKKRVFKNIRFLSLDEWRLEVGEEIFELATME
jgi:hypothetical protein